ncbi:hypothetical protein J5U46_01425 [Micromonospora tulbaghiae]|uniref:Uncharacterized protein n=1 Tax=Micromonospora tulbaghiae TaxID=479978 RepID=A0AAW4JA97_9ACTN|nr:MULTISPECIES: hypothetical protein [Micromonospora]KAB1910035.1 hypothetical protein F8279_01825 [Micromonospora sp. AMSO1212t]MBO4138812.1 hypothetical protein [Micromonospora tulbaghiae]SCF01988.1 hypothetical protein GA0070562_5253 [Micromonospora tulbaghiae]
MSDNHPPYGGYPDPNAGAWGNQPDPNAPYGAQPASGAPYGSQPASGAPYGAQPGSGVPYGAQPASGAPYGAQPGSGAPYGAQPAAPFPGQPGYPGQPAPYAPTPPPSGGKSKGLIVGLAAGAVTLTLLCCGGGLAYVAFNGDEEDPKPVASGSATPGPDNSPSATPSADGPESTGPDGSNNNSLTARYASEMSAVCDGGAILNAAPYTAPAGSKAYVFSNSPDRPSFWSQKTVSSAKPYYAKSADFATVSVIGCLKMVEGSEGTPKKCQYKNSEDKVVTVDYISSRYTLTFHAAKTGEKVGDGGTVTAPAARCPSFISYNKVTMKSYASPDSGTIEAALDRFLK